jgi:hypothetical protein
MTRRNLASAPVERVELPAGLLASARGRVDVEILALLEPENALSVDLEIGRFAHGATPVRAHVVDAIRERIRRREKRGAP